MAKLRRDPDVIVAEVDGKRLLLNLRSWTYLAFNETGSRIWELLDQPADRATLHRRLAAEFEASEEAIGADLDSFLTELRDKGFLASV